MFDKYSLTATTNTMTTQRESDIIFLGLCERASYVREGNTNLFKWNVLGLKHIILSHFYPLSLDGWSIGFAFLSSRMGHEHRFQITDESGNEVGFINLSAKAASPDDEDAVLMRGGPMVHVPQHGWTTAFLPLKDTGFVIQKPGVYHLRTLTDDGPKVVGELQFAVVASRKNVFQQEYVKAAAVE